MVDVVGWAAALIGCCISLPQLLKIVRARSVAGVSLAAWQTMLGANITWTSHGWITGHANVWLPNLLLTACTAVILWQFHRHRGTSWYRLVAPGLALGALSISLDLTLGPIAFAIAAGAPAVVSMIAQLAELVRARDLSGVSPSYIVINVVNQVLWLTWAFLVGDVAVIIVGTALGVLWVTIFTWATLRLTGRVPALGRERVGLV